jgi:hypothetical protein
LDREGDSLFLEDAQSNRVSTVSFGNQLPDRSISFDGSGWILTQPTPGAVNVAIDLAPLSALQLNEILANPAPGQEDWVEFFNAHASLPARLEGYVVRTANASSTYGFPAFVAPRGFVQLVADGKAGPRHLGLKLPADGPELWLFAPGGEQIQSEAYGQEAEGVSFGRYPDGAPSRFNFDGNSTPGLPNAGPAVYQGPRFNEIMARSTFERVTPASGFSDFVELHNPENHRRFAQWLSTGAESWGWWHVCFPLRNQHPGEWLLGRAVRSRHPPRQVRRAVSSMQGSACLVRARF